MAKHAGMVAGVLATCAIAAVRVSTLVLAQVAAAPVEVRVPLAPSPFRGSDGHTHLAYELHLTNFYKSTGPLRLERVAVFGDVARPPLVEYGPRELEERTVRPGAGSTSGNALTIPAGMRAIVHVWLTMKESQAMPRTLRHQITFSGERERKELIDGAMTEVREGPVPILGAPLRGGRWLAHEGPGNHRAHHWSSQLAINGRVTVPQRFAIDLIGVDAEGSAVRGDFRKSANADWPGFGAEVIAAGDGVVREASDSVVDNVPLAPVPRRNGFELATFYGNYVVLELRSNVFVHYAHLQRDSVAVKSGERVRAGQVLGRVGNSGNTNGPHLHFHVSDGPLFANTEGLPFEFEKFELLGETTAARAIGAEPKSPPPAFKPAERRRELPLHGSVVRFP